MLKLLCALSYTWQPEKVLMKKLKIRQTRSLWRLSRLRTSRRKSWNSIFWSSSRWRFSASMVDSLAPSCLQVTHSNQTINFKEDCWILKLFIYIVPILCTKQTFRFFTLSDQNSPKPCLTIWLTVSCGFPYFFLNQPCY